MDRFRARFRTKKGDWKVTREVVKKVVNRKAIVETIAYRI
jgi:hypothetical protein